MKRTSLPAGRASLYDPYLDILGGGEKHILSVLKVLQEEGYESDVFWDENLQKKIEDRFSLHYINKLKFLPNAFRKPLNFIQKIMMLKEYDLFFYVTDGSYFFSSAKKNFIFCMVPDKKLYRLNLLNRTKLFNYKFISNSTFTQQILKTLGIKSIVIYPYLNSDFVNSKAEENKKDKIILSIGRFYEHLHAKQQYKLIDLFNKLKQNNPLYKDYILIIAGGLKEEDSYYFNNLKKIVKNSDDVVLASNISYKELLNLYKKSLFYIHMTGFGIDEDRQPELVEHLGISPLEAMASGCLTFCYRAGGPKEIIEDGVNGYLFQNEQELIRKMTDLTLRPNLQTRIRSQAKKFVASKFSYKVFKKRVIETLL